MIFSENRYPLFRIMLQSTFKPSGVWRARYSCKPHQSISSSVVNSVRRDAQAVIAAISAACAASAR